MYLYFGIRISPRDFTTIQDILSNFTTELGHIRNLTMSLNSLGENRNIDIHTVRLKEEILMRTRDMAIIHDNFSNLYTRISSILEPLKGQVTIGEKRRKTKRRRL